MAPSTPSAAASRARGSSSPRRKPWGSASPPASASAAGLADLPNPGAARRRSQGRTPHPPRAGRESAARLREREGGARSPSKRQQPLPASSALHQLQQQQQQQREQAAAVVEVCPFAEVPEPSEEQSYEHFRATVYEINRIKRAQNDARFRLYMLERQQMKEILGERSDDEYTDDAASEPNSPKPAAASPSRRRRRP